MRTVGDVLSSYTKAPLSIPESQENILKLPNENEYQNKMLIEEKSKRNSKRGYVTNRL